ncbi:MAG: peptide-methionine (S)-S-oxide reductase [Bryobacterales bacterium]|jgi:peptide-methionine (S)-S-oxide reductase|nr:peptide-methionine (S)-S-oxide reductase [Bryobacterales bacterium]
MRILSLRLAVATHLVVAVGLMAASFPDPPSVTVPTAPAAKKATVVLAGGCFWGMEGVFEHVKGVTDTEVGYAGGAKKTAHYEMVSEGSTGHAESLKVTYDPSKITYGQLLKIYFSVAHDPTTLNYQHNDRGTQYRSAIFYADEDQKKLAEAYINQLNEAHVFRSPIVTKLTPLEAFYPAEQHHQHFLDQNPTHPYIVNVDLPLIDALKRQYPDLYKK